MGILSKMREKKAVGKSETNIKKTKEKPKDNVRVKKRKRKDDKERVGVSVGEKDKDILPEIDSVDEWLNEIRNMAKNGLNELDEYYDDIVGSKKDTEFILNLAIVMSNYLSFRYEAYRKLAEHYGDVSKAIKSVDKVMSDVDKEFIDKAVGVIRRWMVSMK